MASEMEMYQMMKEIKALKQQVASLQQKEYRSDSKSLMNHKNNFNSVSPLNVGVRKMTEDDYAKYMPNAQKLSDDDYINHFLKNKKK